MTVDELKELIDVCHAAGKKAALCSCSLVPREVLEAAGIVPIRVLHVDDPADAAGRMLINNVCNIVKEFCNLYEDPRIAHADIIMAETSCDGKKKMHELLTNQERMIYYQVPQGTGRSYVKKLLISETNYLIRKLEQSFGVVVTEEALRKASADANEERCALAELMSLQQADPVPMTGKEFYIWLQEAAKLLSAKERAAYYRAKKQEVLDRTAVGTKNTARILLTGCPLSGVYEKVIDAVENNGGVIVCVENCEAMKGVVMQVNTENPDIIDALADCYIESSCAIMDFNEKRFRLLQDLSREYSVAGIIDIEMAVCHPYTIEKYKVGRMCKEIRLPYLAIETDDSPNDHGQINTRVAAFVEML